MTVREWIVNVLFRLAGWLLTDRQASKAQRIQEIDKAIEMYRLRRDLDDFGRGR